MCHRNVLWYYRRRSIFTHDLALYPSPSASSVNAVDTDFALAPEAEFGKVLLDIAWRGCLWLRSRFGTAARIVLSEVIVTDDSRQVGVD